MRWPLALLAATLVLAGCGKDPAASHRPAQPMLRVWVTKEGEVRAEGRTVTLEELGKRFAELSRAKGYVFYFREDPTAAEPPPIAMKVAALIVAHRLPVRIAAGPEFEDAVDLSDRVPPEGD